MRLIDADKLENRKFAGLVHGDAEENTYRLGWNNAIEAIMDNEPTANKRLKAEWVLVDDPNETISYGTDFRCTNCKDVIDDIPTCMNKPLYNFCPNCGADMRGGQDNDPN